MRRSSLSRTAPCSLKSGWNASSTPYAHPPQRDRSRNNRSLTARRSARVTVIVRRGQPALRDRSSSVATVGVQERRVAVAGDGEGDDQVAEMV